MTRLVRLIPVLFLLASAGCDTSPDPDPDPVDDDDVTDSPDDDDTALLEAVTSVIGPDGGSISLSDGTTLVVPAGAVEEETEFTIEPTDPVETPYDDGRFVRVGTPFLVSPSIGVEPPAVVEYVVPVDELPDGVTSGDVVLVATSIGIAEALSVEEEGDEPATEMGLVHPMWGAASASDDEATFAWASVTPATLQPMVPVTPLGLPGPPPEVPEGAYGGLQIGTDCSSILTLYTGSPPANINSDVALTVPLSAPAWAHYNALPAANQQQFADSVERFLARVCLSTWRAVQYYSNEMGFFPIPRPVPVTVDWASQFRPGISRCIGGSANGQGVNFFFAGDSNVAPCTPPANYPGFSVNWNTAPPAGTPPDQWLDRLDHISVHELFHYVDDWANYLDDNLYGFAGGGGQFHTEGAAVAAQEEVFDDWTGISGIPYPIWFRSLLSPTNPEQYYGHSFWRFLDWTQESPARTSAPIRRVHDYVRGRSSWAGNHSQLMLSDLDTLATDLFPSESWDHRDLMAEYSAAMMYTHDFERWTGTGPPSPGDYDLYPDAMAAQSDENGTLWANWLGVGFPTPWSTTAPNQASLIPTSPLVLPMSVGLNAMPPLTGRVVDILLTGAQGQDVDPDIDLSITASGPSGQVSDVTVRLYSRDLAGGIGTVLLDTDTLSVVPTAPTYAGIPQPVGASQRLALVAFNRTGDPVDVNVTLTAVEDRLLAVGRDIGGVDTIWVFEASGTTATPMLLGAGALPSFATGLGARMAAVCKVGPRKAFVSLADSEIAVFDLTEGNEAEIDVDGDASNGVTRIDLGTVPVLTEPRGMACLTRQPRLLVAADHGLVVIDTITHQVVSTVPNASLLGPTPPSANGRPWNVAVLSDDTKGYAVLHDPFSTDERRVAVLNVSAIAAGATDPGVVTAYIERSGDATNGRSVSVSRNDDRIALTIPALNATNLIRTSDETDFDVGAAGTPVYAYPNSSFTSSLGALHTAWGPGDLQVYVGFSAGAPGSSVGLNGVVHACLPGLDWCDHSVGVECTVRGVAVTGAAGSHTVWALDSCGYLTGLSSDLFLPGTTTLGWSEGCASYSELDGTGGCLDVVACPDKPMAESCTDLVSTPTIGMPGVDLIAF